MEPEAFGKYRLIRRIATGGMAEIFLARSIGEAGFEKTLIVKRILPKLIARPKFVRMFVNEAKVTSLLSHSNIVQVFDFGRIGADYFIAMEYVDGNDLRSLVKTARACGVTIPRDVSVYLALNVVRGLEYAHQRGVVHRDVSPQNVLVSWAGEVKLADFGIAKVEQWTSLTRAGEVKGNFGYMAPEQTGGGAVTAAADVYAAGLVLYELLTLTNPFAKGTIPEVIQRIRTQTPVRPSAINPTTGRPLDDIVMRCLAKRPSERMASAGELREALAVQIAGRSTDSLMGETAALVQDLMRPAPSRPASVSPRVFASRDNFPIVQGKPLEEASGLWSVTPEEQPLEGPTPLAARGRGSEVSTVSTSPEPSVSSTAKPDIPTLQKVRDLSNLARIRLFVAPRKVEVYIDDSRIHVGAPVEIQTSANVEHELRLSAVGFDDFETTFVLTPGEIRDVSIVLAGR